MSDLKPPGFNKGTSGSDKSGGNSPASPPKGVKVYDRPASTGLSPAIIAVIVVIIAILAYVIWHYMHVH